MKDVNIQALFSEINDKREMHGIKQWGINQTSLEDVFVAVCGTEE